MRVITENENVVEIPDERWEAFLAFEKSEAKEWPQHNAPYFYIDAMGGIHKCQFSNESDIACLSISNCYRTESEALAQVEKLKAKARIDKYIRDNGLEFVPDWGDAEQVKAVILYNHHAQIFTWDVYSSVQFIGHVFAGKDHAFQVINNCTDDLKTLFGVK